MIVYFTINCDALAETDQNQDIWSYPIAIKKNEQPRCTIQSN